jgi:hypothetical protein
MPRNIVPARESSQWLNKKFMRIIPRTLCLMFPAH